MQQKVTYQRALEGEVASTVNGVSGVSNAQVQLVLPEDDLFADTATPATAAVMLGNPADAMESGAVQGIAQLVSSSVKGLKKDNVTITDSTGQVLWPQGDAAGGAGGVGLVQAWRPRRASTARWSPTSTRCSPARSAPTRPTCRSTPTSTSTRRRATSSSTPRRACR